MQVVGKGRERAREKRNIQVVQSLPLSFPPENHREESAFENHLTAKVLVVCSSSPLHPPPSPHPSTQPPRSPGSCLSLSPPVHFLQLLCGALPHCLLQAGRAFAPQGNMQSNPIRIPSLNSLSNMVLTEKKKIAETICLRLQFTPE